MKKTLLALSTAALCLGLSATASFAQSSAPKGAASAPATSSTPSTTTAPSNGPMAKADTKAMKKKADADYKTAKDACKPMKGAEQKACMKQAKADHAKAEADNKAAKK